MKICISCEARIPDDAEVCDRCGQEQRAPVSGQREAAAVFSRSPAPLYTEAEVKGAEEETSSLQAAPTSKPYSSTATGPSEEETSSLQAAPPAPLYSDLPASFSQKNAVGSVFEEPYTEAFSETETPTLLAAPAHSHQRGRWIFILACLLVVLGSLGTTLILYAYSHHSTGSAQPSAAHLTVTPASLDFGQVPQGTKVVLAAYVANTGKQPLNWKVDTSGTSWLGVKTNAGMIQPGAAPQPVYTFVDTTQLKKGTYSGIEHIQSNGGDTGIQAKLTVVAAGAKQGAKLKIIPNSIDFGSVQVGQQISSPVAVSNLGNADLHWKASIQNTSWLSLDTASGTIPMGGLPQTVNLTANTMQLAPANYSAIVAISSNGGNVDIGVTLTVIGGSLPTSSLTLSPLSLESNSSSCSRNSNGTFNCTVTLANGSSQGTLNWSGQTNSGGNINPSNGQLLAGQRVSILLSSIPCKNGSFTFSAAGSNSVSVPWSCSITPTPPPTWSVSPTSSGSNCSTGCTLTLTENAGSTGNINWAASSNAGVTFNPASGTLSSGQSQRIVVTQGTCNSGTLTFTGSNGAKTLTVKWSCSLPPSPPSQSWSVSPTSLDATQSQCGITTSCQVTLSEDSSSSGPINWSASSDTGATFSSTSGTLTPGQTQTITISGLTCQKGTITFSASGASDLSVPWTCTPDSQNLSASPSSFTDGCVSCTVTLTSLSETSTISWSASSTVSGVSFSPASGTLAPGQSVSVGVTPNQACPASNNFIFTGPGNSVSVSWSCSGSNLTIGPTSFNPTDCNSDGNGNWQCILTLTSDPNNQGTLSWSASINGGSGITLSQSSGQLNPGGEAQIVALIPQSNCSGSGQISFQGPTNAATSTWSC